MKITCVLGSVKGGIKSFSKTVSGFLIDKIRQISDEEVFVEEVVLRNCNIERCVGCIRCTRKGVCRFEDDVTMIKNKLLEADVVLFCSGTYVGNVSNDMKKLFERLIQMIHQRSLSGKIGAVVVTSGAKQMGEMTSYYLRNVVRHLGVAVISDIRYSGFVWPDPLEPMLSNQIQESAQEIVKSYQQHLYNYVEPEFGLGFEEMVAENPSMSKYLERYFGSDIAYWKKENK